MSSEMPFFGSKLSTIWWGFCLDTWTWSLWFQTAKALEEKLKKANVPLEVYLYPNVGHAFINSSPEAIEWKKATGFGEHHQEAVDLAWSRFDLWFKKYLQVGKWNHL
jgi:carboxymethylenebutenolidase